MARKRAKPEVVEIRAEDISQEVPDEQPPAKTPPASKRRPRGPGRAQRSSDEARDPTSSRAKAITKSAAARVAVDPGAESPEDGVAFIKARYGLDISKTHCSAVKSKY